MERVLVNDRQDFPLFHAIGETKASIVLIVLAIAMYHRGQARVASAPEEEASSSRQSDHMFSYAVRLADTATGYPNLESVQAKLIQVLYLLHTSRMNQAWYVFGAAFQTGAAISLHRRDERVRAASRATGRNYVRSQSRKRTFWVAYILDQYLGVILGRPRHYHDQDIDQTFPDCVDDEDMTPEGPPKNREAEGLLSSVPSVSCKVGLESLASPCLLLNPP